MTTSSTRRSLGSAVLERHAFEEMLGGRARAGLLRVTADTFTKDGRAIPFKRAWLAEARQAGVPAFRVLHDRTLLAIAAARPRDEAALFAVPGFGPGLLKRYGDRILALCRGTGSGGIARSASATLSQSVRRVGTRSR